jgi:hypothetical protein
MPWRREGIGPQLSWKLNAAQITTVSVSGQTGLYFCRWWMRASAPA